MNEQKITLIIHPPPNTKIDAYINAKSCPKCGGDVYLVRGMSQYVECENWEKCGHRFLLND